MATAAGYTTDQFIGSTVHSADGEKLGKIDELYYDAGSGRVEWLGVTSGLLGMRKTWVPATGARLDGDNLTLGYTKAEVERAADLRDRGMGTEQDERGLYETYGLDYPGRSFDYESVGTVDADRNMTTIETAPPATAAPAPAAPVATETGTADVVRHEEELAVGKQQVSGGSVRLRKWVETQPVEREVFLEREVAHVRREPIANDAHPSSHIHEEQVQVDLRAEEPVVGKQVVAKERVGIETGVETEVRTVGGDVRREHVEVETDGGVTDGVRR